MRACKLVGPKNFGIFEQEVPEIEPDEVLVKVRFCGVCASEIHEWLEPSSQDRIIGHEVVGEVSRVGSAVSRFKPGDRVTGLIWQGFAEYAKAKEQRVVAIPDNVLDIHAIGEPLSCLVSAADRTPFAIGTTVAIIGAGFMGLGLIQLLRLKGAGKIIVVDIRSDSLALARQFGADETYFPDQIPASYIVDSWNDRILIDGIPVVVEVTGQQSGLDLASRMVSVHGHLSIVGYHASNGGIRQINMGLWNWKGFNVCNAHERRDEVLIAAQEAILSILSAGRFQMEGLITHEVDMEHINDAFQNQIEKKDGYVKAVVKIG
jgi:threonine dehydrogenase-like Zn-dependent dehydrogenase